MFAWKINYSRLSLILFTTPNSLKVFIWKLYAHLVFMMLLPLERFFPLFLFLLLCFCYQKHFLLIPHWIFIHAHVHTFHIVREANNNSRWGKRKYFQHVAMGVVVISTATMRESLCHFIYFNTDDYKNVLSLTFFSR